MNKYKTTRIISYLVALDLLSMRWRFNRVFHTLSSSCQAYLGIAFDQSITIARY
jgi:hypothetical protein